MSSWGTRIGVVLVRRVPSGALIVIGALVLTIALIHNVTLLLNAKTDDNYRVSRSLTTKETIQMQSLKSTQLSQDDLEITRVLGSTPIDDKTQDSAQQCAHHPYGKVTVFVAYVTESYKTHYAVAQQTLKCYLNRTDYELQLVDLNLDQLVKDRCTHDQLFFRKHCAASVYLELTDWLIVLDADTAVVNPDRCFEEYIDPRFDLIFYERFFNWEIASGNYIARNTPYARKFLLDWANYQFEQPSGFTGADNGALQLHLLRTILPEATHEAEICDLIWRNATTYETYMAYVTCCKVGRGAKYDWEKVRIYRRAHGWVQDWFLTSDRFCDKHFMFHGWKANAIGDAGWSSPFHRVPNGSECQPNHVWPHRTGNRISCEKVRESLAASERGTAKGYPKVASILPHLLYSDVGECWPDCGLKKSVK